MTQCCGKLPGLEFIIFLYQVTQFRSQIQFNSIVFVFRNVVGARQRERLRHKLLKKKLQEELNKEEFSMKTVEVAGVSRECIDYSVSTLPSARVTPPAAGQTARCHESVP